MVDDLTHLMLLCGLCKVSQRIDLISVDSVLGMTRQKNYTDIAAQFPELFGKSYPVHCGHLDIKKNDIERLVLKTLQQFFSAAEILGDDIQTVIHSVHQSSEKGDEISIIITDSYAHIISPPQNIP